MTSNSGFDSGILVFVIILVIYVIIMVLYVNVISIPTSITTTYEYYSLILTELSPELSPYGIGR